MRWLQIAGLLIDFAGALILCVPAFSSKKQALNVGVGVWAHEEDEKNLELPAVKERLRASRFAMIGTPLIALGFLMQLAAAWIQP